MRRMILGMVVLLHAGQALGTDLPASPEECPGQLHALASIGVSVPSAVALGDGLRSAAERQATTECAGVTLTIGALMALRRAESLDPSLARDYRDLATELAHEGWIVHPTPSSALIRAVVGEAALPAQPLSQAVEEVGEMWVDAVLESTRGDGWQLQPSAIRQVIVYHARRFALEQLGGNQGLERATWSAMRALAQIAVQFDRPTTDPTRGSEWRDTFPQNKEPNEADLRQRLERAGVASWIQALPLVPTPDGAQLAAGTYWREYLYRPDSPEYLSASEYLDARYTMGSEGGLQMSVLERALSRVSEPGPSLPEEAALIATGPSGSWSSGRQRVLATLKAHALVRDTPDPATPEGWERVSSALDLVLRAADLTTDLRADGAGPFDVEVVTTEVVGAVLGVLASGSTPGEPVDEASNRRAGELVSQRADEVADQLAIVAGRVPLGGRALLIATKVAKDVMPVSRRQQLVRKANDTTWRLASRDDVSLDIWLMQMSTWLHSSKDLDALVSDDRRSLVPYFQPDPVTFEKRFTARMVASSEIAEEIKHPSLERSGCDYLIEVTDSSLIEGLYWKDLGFISTLPGSTGIELTQQLALLRKVSDNPARCKLPDPLLPTAPEFLDPRRVPLAVQASQMQAWFAVTHPLAELAPEDPARLGGDYVTGALAAPLEAMFQEGALPFSDRELESLGCEATKALSLTKGQGPANAFRSRIGLSGCTASPAGAGGFAEVPLAVRMSTPPSPEEVEVHVEGTANALELSTWLTHTFRGRLQEAKGTAAWPSVLVPVSGTSTLRMGSSLCILHENIISHGLTVYGHRHGCVPGLPPGYEGGR